MFMVYSGDDVMNKSIEEQAEESADNYGMIFSAQEFKVYKDAYINAVKARDAQLLDVVNEMKQALEYYKSNAMTFRHCQEISPDVEEYCNGEIAEDCLTKADQLLKEMNINKGE